MSRQLKPEHCCECQAELGPAFIRSGRSYCCECYLRELKEQWRRNNQTGQQPRTIKIKGYQVIIG